jgi:hypothetical protein
VLPRADMWPMFQSLDRPKGNREKQEGGGGEAGGLPLPADVYGQPAGGLAGGFLGGFAGGHAGSGEVGGLLSPTPSGIKLTGPGGSALSALAKALPEIRMRQEVQNALYGEPGRPPTLAQKRRQMAEFLRKTAASYGLTPEQMHTLGSGGAADAALQQTVREFLRMAREQEDKQARDYKIFESPLLGSLLGRPFSAGRDTVQSLLAMDTDTRGLLYNESYTGSTPFDREYRRQLKELSHTDRMKVIAGLRGLGIDHQMPDTAVLQSDTADEMGGIYPYVLGAQRTVHGALEDPSTLLMPRLFGAVPKAYRGVVGIGSVGLFGGMAGKDLAGAIVSGNKEAMGGAGVNALLALYGLKQGVTGVKEMQALRAAAEGRALLPERVLRSLEAQGVKPPGGRWSRELQQAVALEALGYKPEGAVFFDRGTGEFYTEYATGTGRRVARVTLGPGVAEEAAWQAVRSGRGLQMVGEGTVEGARLTQAESPTAARGTTGRVTQPSEGLVYPPRGESGGPQPRVAGGPRPGGAGPAAGGGYGRAAGGGRPPSLEAVAEFYGLPSPGTGSTSEATVGSTLRTTRGNLVDYLGMDETGRHVIRWPNAAREALTPEQADQVFGGRLEAYNGPDAALQTSKHKQDYPLGHWRWGPRPLERIWVAYKGPGSGRPAFSGTLYLNEHALQLIKETIHEEGRLLGLTKDPVKMKKAANDLIGPDELSGPAADRCGAAKAGPVGLRHPYGGARERASADGGAVAEGLYGAAAGMGQDGEGVGGRHTGDDEDSGRGVVPPGTAQATCPANEQEPASLVDRGNCRWSQTNGVNSASGICDCRTGAKRAGVYGQPTGDHRGDGGQNRLRPEN